MHENENDKEIGPESYVLLSEVPEEYYDHGPMRNPSLRWHLQFNVAAWIQLDRPSTLPITLVIVYRDAVKLREVEVECSNSTQTSIMLSGIATLPAIGELSQMSIEVKGVDESISVMIDELYIQKITKEADSKSGTSPKRAQRRA